MAEPVPAEVLQALSHPLRLAILIALEERARSRADLATTLDLSPTALDHHLDTLRGAGLITTTDAGLLRAKGHGWAEIAEHLRRMQEGLEG